MNVRSIYNINNMKTLDNFTIKQICEGIENVCGKDTLNIVIASIRGVYNLSEDTTVDDIANIILKFDFVDNLYYVLLSDEIYEVEHYLIGKYE